MPVIDTLDQLETLRSQLLPDVCLSSIPSIIPNSTVESSTPRLISPHEPASKLSIPKIIHQTWKTKDIPNHWKSSHLGWIRYHPEYYYILWTDEMNLDLVRRFYPEFLEKYLSFPYNIQRVDAVRAFYLHRYGGVYSDLDIEPLKDISSYLQGGGELVLLKDIGSFGKWKKIMSKQGGILEGVMNHIEQYGRYTNMLMASRPGSYFWNRVVERMLKPVVPWWAGSYHFYIMKTTGPFIIDNVAKQYDIDYPGSIDLFPYQKFQPCTICDEKPCSTSDSYVQFLNGSSWGNLNSRIVTTCSCNWHLIVVVVILIIVAILIWVFLVHRS